MSNLALQPSAFLKRSVTNSTSGSTLSLCTLSSKHRNIRLLPKHKKRQMILAYPSLPYKPVRIVSLVPSQTELLADLGLEAETVGITKFCVHPNDWFRNKTRVGGTKSVHIDKVKALQPDLIIANKEENVQEQVEALAEVAPIWVSDIQTLEEALKMIQDV